MEFATAGEIRITSIQVTPGGVKIQWNPLTGTLYTVEATGAIGTAFTALAPNLEVSEYLDTSAKLQSMRFYRVHAQ